MNRAASTTLRLTLLAVATACGPTNDLPATQGDLTVHIRGSTQAFPHADTYAGQTARAVRGGIRSLSLLRTADDPTPLRLFNHGKDAVEVGYNQGDDTVVAQVPSSSLRAGVFTLARMVQTHSRFQVDVAWHQGGTMTPSVLDELVVMSNDTNVDGAVRPAGFYNATLQAGADGQVFTGEDWPVPPLSTTAGAWAVVEDGDWAVYFPVHVELGVAAVAALTVEVNMDHAFRWQDASTTGFQPQMWDLQDGAWENVVQFGGNRFDVTVQ